tara:strand:- start:417 stop:665 length:249 start_codon:yes stop_codon:yes gene_type:complete
MNGNYKNMYIVTRVLNAYDQDGEYFVAAYLEKPTFKELRGLLSLDTVTTGKLLKGGGRQDHEDEWFYLREIAIGESFEQGGY